MEVSRSIVQLPYHSQGIMLYDVLHLLAVTRTAKMQGNYNYPNKVVGT